MKCQDCKFDANNPLQVQVVKETGAILLTIKPSKEIVDISNEYTDRIKFRGLLSTLDVMFIMKNVTKDDAGMYTCMQGSSVTCKTLLVVIGM